MIDSKTIREVAEDFGDQMKKLGEHAVKVNIIHIINSTEDEHETIQLILEYLGEEYDTDIG